MDYTEFIDTNLATNMQNIFQKMNDMNIISKKELDTNMNILKKTIKTLEKNNTKDKK